MQTFLETNSILNRKKNYVCICTHMCSLCMPYMYGGQKPLWELVLAFCDVPQDQTQVARLGS